MNFARHSVFALCFLIAVSTAAYFKPAQAASPPSVLVSIKPIHSLLAAVADGVFEPHLLLDGLSSPHHFQLKPSAVKLIHQSDRVFWVGEGLELFLIKTLRGVSDDNKAQKLIDVPGLFLLPLREKYSHDHGAEDSDHETHDENHNDQASVPRYPDSHFWLDPVNASILVRYFADMLAAIDPANAETYQLNATSLQGRLKQLTEDLQELLTQSRGKPYLVFHDSLQYFEKRFNLTSAGVISIQPDALPSARRIRELQHLIEHESVQCLFSEPQFQSRSVQMLVEDADIKHAMIDPLGSAEPASAAMYFDWLKNTAIAIDECLRD